MEFIVKITPKFDAKNIFNETLRKDWFIFQSEVFTLGQSLAKYIQNYINTRRRRRGSTGNLARAITFEPISTAPATIGWGIGNIHVLNQVAKYWYVVNYGKTVGGQPYVPNKGKFIPGSFEGTPPDPALKGGVQKFNYNDGSNMGMYAKSPIRPLNYIQAGHRRVDLQLKALIIKLRKGI